MRKLIISGSLLLAHFLAFSQQDQIKFEQEDRAKIEQVPAPALAFVEDCGLAKRVKWYQEYSQDGHSFEAKVKANGIRYSIEFDSVGHIQDVELKIKWAQIPQKTRLQIQQGLDTTFKRHRVKKIQLQWTGAEASLQKLIRQEEAAHSYTSKYEIVLIGTSNGKTHWYEMLFDADGKRERISRFFPRNTDNLDY